jgi:hypothetical protein
MDPELVKLFIPPPISEAILNGTVELSELRRVTTMFCKLDSFDVTKHGDALSLQDYVYAIQMALASTGGFLRQILVDDKGIANIFNIEYLPIPCNYCVCCLFMAHHHYDNTILYRLCGDRHVGRTFLLPQE